MFPTASYPIRANRYVLHTDYIDVVGYDFTGATFAMEVRDTYNGGAVRASIIPTVAVTVTEGVPTSRVTWVIPKATMAAMPLDQSDPTKDVTLYYDLQIDPSVGDSFVAWRGTFVVVAGSVQ